ncbi:hypothetical protein [Microbispora sp. CA-102843]|uniref:hypothetical protein n=1 Tax=Microbispora sp. CA-102843 TaxID=3239952 RepID=UPI003D8E4EFC
MRNACLARLTRRALLSGGGVVAAGVTSAAVVARASADTEDPCTAGCTADPGAGSLQAAVVEPFHGAHQAGVATPPQAHAALWRSTCGRERTERAWRG